MGSCSSRSNDDVVLLTPTTDYSMTTRRPSSREGLPSRRGSSPSPLVAYLTELDSSANDEMRARHGRSRMRLRRNNSNLRRHAARTPEEERQRISEIEQLQQSLAAMEDFFQTLLGQAQIYMEAMDPSGGAGSGPPPASEQAIRNLPMVALHELSRDNKTCGICCENHVVGDQVTQMPCGHAYHGACLEPWLSRHCTCPVCRYELPTDDAGYEPGRRERMAVRKISTDNVQEQQDETLEQEESRQEEGTSTVDYSETS